MALGFNLNEGRAYAALLEGGPCTGYEVSQHAGVARSAAYNVLRRLVETGAARSIPGSPERFVATPPEGLVAMLRKRFESSAEHLASAAQELATPAEPSAYRVRGYRRVIEEAGTLIDASDEALLVSGWPREIESLRKELTAAERRGVYVVVFSHATLREDTPGERFSYGVDEVELESFWPHRLLVVKDHRRTLVGDAAGRDDDTAIVSDTPAVVELATGQVALDITLLAHRRGQDVQEVMSRALGHRVGRLDDLLAS